MDTKEQAKAEPKNPQWAWLEEKLKNRREDTITLIFIHRPLVSLGRKKNGKLKYKYEKFSKLIGEQVAKLHSNGIIHADLTTSNMLYADKLYFIDFGLSFFSDKIEDKAVDLHLLKQALESKHFGVFDEAFKIILNTYKEKATDAEAVLERFEVVEKRGRYKQQH